MGVEPNAQTLQEFVAPTEHASPFSQEVRSGIEPDLLPYQGSVPPEHLQTVRKSDPGWNRTIGFLDVGQASLPLDHGIVCLQVTEVGVEPTNSRVSRTRRFACLRTRPNKLQVPVSNRGVGRMKPNWAPAAPAPT